MVAADVSEQGMRAIYQAFSELQGVSQYLDLLDFELLNAGAFLMDEMTPHLSAPWCKNAGLDDSGQR